MRRRSQQIQINFLRVQRKNKTEGFKKQQQFKAKEFNNSEIFVSEILNQVIEASEPQIQTRSHSSLIDLVIENCAKMAHCMHITAFPEVDQFNNEKIEPDFQPERALYDPICGFDKLITMKNETLSNQETPSSQSKSKPFSMQVFQKQQSFNKCFLEPRLVPLESLSKSKLDDETEKLQGYYRERIFLSVLPAISPSLKIEDNKGVVVFSKSNSSENEAYDYKGKKIAICSSKMNVSRSIIENSNVLRTTYEVGEKQLIGEIYVGKGKKTRKPNQINYKIKEEAIFNPKLRDRQKENSFFNKSSATPAIGQKVKTILEASFRNREIRLRPMNQAEMERIGKH